MSHRFALFICAFILGPSLATPSTSRADDTHHQPIFAGARAMGMGTAFTGVANDGSALYHNPAGVLSLQEVEFGAGFWVNAFDNVTIAEGLQTPDGSVPVESQTRPSIPSFGSLIIPFGSHDLQGRTRYAFGFSAFRLRNDNRSFGATYQSAGVLRSVEVDARDQINLYGLSLAAASRNFGSRFGLSVFLSQRMFRHREGLTASFGDPTAAGELTNSTTLDRSNRFRLNSFDFVIRAGYMQKLAHGLDLGVMIQSPGIRVKTRADVFSRNLLTNEADESEFVGLTDERGLRARSLIPAQVRVGLGFRPTEWATFSLDLGFVMPILSHPVVSEPVPGLRQSVADTYLFLDTNTRRYFTWNAAIGLELVANDKFMFRLGALTDRSSAPRVRSGPGYRNPRIHRYGFSAAMGARGSRFGLSFGAVALWGSGRALSVGADPSLGDVSYLPVDATARVIVFQLSGSTSPLRMAARGLTDTLMH